MIAPLRDKPWSRDEEIAYAAERGIPVEAKPDSPFSIDDNLFGRAIEAGVLEDPWAAPPEEAFVLTVAPSAAAEPVEVVIGFEAGLPVSLDGEELPLAELVAALNELAGSRGIGRIDMIENRVVGIKSRELYEAPAALTLIKAHDALEDLVLTKAEQIAKRELEPKWAQLVYDGFWFTPGARRLRRVLRRDAEARHGRGAGAARVRARQSSPAGAREHALYAETLASYATGETFPHESAEGFISLLGLEAQLAAARAHQQDQVAVG